jgi:meso-butanediol dehydrogenase / (S,S)-butanediol dehydrogenase / diacetyl reductase
MTDVEPRTEVRAAMVTGAARGIGRAIALRLAADGFDVGVNDLPALEEDVRSVVAAIRDLRRRSVELIGDVSDPDQVQTMVDKHVEVLDRLDVMVANAGIAPVGALIEMSVEDWDRIMAINARGVFLCYRAAAQRMIEQGRGGKIIGAASVAAHKGGALQGAYSASKFAIRGLTHSAAQELAPYGITVNTYCPGIVDTPMWAGIDAALTARTGAARGSALHEMTAQITLGRLEQPEDVAALVSFLASKDSDYITGQSIIVDGGFLFT